MYKPEVVSPFNRVCEQSLGCLYRTPTVIKKEKVFDQRLVDFVQSSQLRVMTLCFGSLVVKTVEMILLLFGPAMACSLTVYSVEEVS